MHRLLLRAGLVTFFISTLSSGQAVTQSTIVAELKSPEFMRRYEGVKQTIRNETNLSNPAVQRLLIDLLGRESNDSAWSFNEEGVECEEYYSVLCDAVQRIASESDSSQASMAVLHSHFNDDSAFAKSLVAQAGAARYRFQLSNDRSDFIRGQSRFLLASSLANCARPTTEGSCANSQVNASAVLSLLRTGA